MILRCTVRSTEMWSGEVQADDIASAREALDARVPEGFEMARVRPVDGKAGWYGAVAESRVTRELLGEGDSYDHAYVAFRAQIPDGWVMIERPRRDEGDGMGRRRAS